MTDASRPTMPAAALAVLLLVTLALTFLASGPGVLPGDVAIAHWVQATPLPGANRIAQLGYLAGHAPVVMAVNLLVALALWVAGRPRLAVIALAILLLRVLNPLLKVLVVSPRPTSDLVRVTEWAAGFGFPSGHVMSVTLVYGGIIWLAEEAIAPLWPRRAIQILAVLVLLATAFGRVYTGAHWPSDVLGGFLWGLVLLALLALVAPRILPEREA